MDFDEITDRYRNTNFVVRLIIVLIAAAIIPAFIVWDEAPGLQEELENAQNSHSAMKAKLARAERDKAELPALEQRLATIERGLERARKVLPQSIEFDEILSATGLYEKETGVQLVRFAPGSEIQPDPAIRYAEIPVEITVRANFGRVMQFLDRLVHMEKLTHLRHISFETVTDKSEPGTVTAKASLILFRDLG